MFVENHKYKKSQQKERLADRKAQCEDKSNQFDVVVKAQSPRRKISIIVEAKHVGAFQKALIQMQQS